MPLADLHTHTTCSDGSLAPAALVARAHAAGVAVLAVTDHDTLDGVPEAAAEARRRGMGFVAGVELSVTVDGQEVDLLAYGVRLDHGPLNAHLAAFRTARAERGRAMTAKLRALGVPVTDEAVAARAGTGVVARPHVAAEVVAVGAAGSVGEAFERFLTDGAPAHVAKPEANGAAMLRLVHAAGGVGVVAHPGRLPDDRALDALLKAGLDGIEVVHPAHGWATERYLREEVRRRGLYATGGSDYHGRTFDEPRLGRYGVPVDAVEGISRLV